MNTYCFQIVSYIDLEKNEGSQVFSIVERNYSCEDTASLLSNLRLAATVTGRAKGV
jgi:hypothetical protein